VSKKPGGGKPPAVAKPPHHAAGAAPSRAHLQREVNRLQRQVSRLQHSGKHPHSTAKHHPHKGSKKHAKRGLALGDMVACCAAEALAASLRLAGQPVSDDDVLALYFYTASGPDDGASILETLEAAQEFGLAGVRPVSYGMAGRDSNSQTPIPGRSASARLLAHTAPDSNPAPGHPSNQGNALVLGVDLAGPHTVTVDADGQWLTWGAALPPFPGAVVEEAWEITWS